MDGEKHGRTGLQKNDLWAAGGFGSSEAPGMGWSRQVEDSIDPSLGLTWDVGGWGRVSELIYGPGAEKYAFIELRRETGQRAMSSAVVVGQLGGDGISPQSDKKKKLSRLRKKDREGQDL